jgi:hypothetical protein
MKRSVYAGSTNLAGQGDDGYIGGIQKQIASKEEKLKKLSEDNTITPEEKIKLQKEIRDEIKALQDDITKHQLEKKEEERKKIEEDMKKKLEKLAEKQRSKDEEVVAPSFNTMNKLISADQSMEQVDGLEKVKTKMESDISTAQIEMKLNASRAGSNESSWQEGIISDSSETIEKIDAQIYDRIGKTLKDIHEPESKEDKKEKEKLEEQRKKEVAEREAIEKAKEMKQEGKVEDDDSKIVDTSTITGNREVDSTGNDTVTMESISNTVTYSSTEVKSEVKAEAFPVSKVESQNVSVTKDEIDVARNYVPIDIYL